VGNQSSREIWDLLHPIGYDHSYMSFMCSCVLLLMVFLASCIFVVGGVAYVYMCGFIVEWVRWHFAFVCKVVYICVLFSVLVYFIIFLCFCIFVLLVWCLFNFQ